MGLIALSDTASDMNFGIRATWAITACEWALIEMEHLRGETIMNNKPIIFNKEDFIETAIDIHKGDIAW